MQPLPYPDRERALWIYRQMVRIREFEERVKRTFAEHPGMIRGHTHLGDGAEATIVGAIAAIRPDDYVLATYRCHGYLIALGSSPRAMMAEIYGKATGLSHGLAGSMHLADPEHQFLGTSGIVGQGIPHATGVALAIQVRGSDQVVLCFFGDGAAKQGAFHESLNIASLWKLPVVYILENNLYQAVTRVEMEDANAAAGEPLSTKARAYSMPGVTIDGTDPIAVLTTVANAVERARRGEGPTLIESVFYRFSAHGNIIVPPPVPLHFEEHEALTIYQCADEYEQWRQRDPIPRFRAWLGGIGVSEDELVAIESAAREEMDDAVRFALESPWPEPDILQRYVYA